MPSVACRIVPPGFCWLMLIIWAALSAACAAPAYLKVDKQASEFGFSRTVVEGDGFRHVVYGSVRETTSRRVHVYIDGDGVNWQWGRLIKSDPTPDRALTLDLMGLDRGNTLFVGRPCYFGLELDDECDADLWTFARYSEKVVTSMVDVIAKRTSQYSDIVLIGHSGGGTIALLVAEQLPRVTAVVTVAGNIDTDAWTQHHGYTPLYGSVNPATRGPLPSQIKQLHLVGGKDTNIPPALSRLWIQSQPAATLREIPSNTHLCCWKKDWASVLRWIALEV